MTLPFPQIVLGEGGVGEGGGKKANIFQSNLQDLTSNIKLVNSLPQDNKCCSKFGSVPLSLPHPNSE